MMTSLTDTLKQTNVNINANLKKCKINIIEQHSNTVNTNFKKCNLDNYTLGVSHPNNTNKQHGLHKIDVEWAAFLSSYEKNNSCKIMTSISSIQTTDNFDEKYDNSNIDNDKTENGDESKNNYNDNYELNISTKTKILFLNKPIDIYLLFWKITVINYIIPTEGVVKKTIKIVSKTKKEFEEYQEKIKNIGGRYKESFIKQIDNPTARSIKFKDERKLTIGIARKDVLNNKLRIKNTFYNCFVVIIRVQQYGFFKEIHIKIFNTGKVEIPGVLTDDLLDIVKQKILIMIDDNTLKFAESDISSNILINSNFNCGYYINRDKLHDVLRNKNYELEAVYDPCSYPAVKCKFYFNNELGFDNEKQNGRITKEDVGMKMTELGETKKYTEISFMIFRTGSGLIIGNCSDEIIYYLFEFIKRILKNEKHIICESNKSVVLKKKIVRTRNITLKITKECYNKTQI
jgi:hypothetical protein